MKFNGKQSIFIGSAFLLIIATVLSGQFKATPNCPTLTDSHLREWREALGVNSGDARYQLATDLVSCRHFIGKSAEQIKTEFGAPDKSERFGNDINYVLGHNHGEYSFGMDRDWLTLWIENGKVKKAAITSD